MAIRKIELFAGAGGGILAGKLLGHRCVAAVEIEPHNQAILSARMADGCLAQMELHDDVCTFDGAAYENKVDLVCGGFPCQNISVSGKQEGLSGEKSRLVWEMLRVARDTQAPLIFAENSPNLRTKGLREIVEVLQKMGYNRIAWTVLAASDVGAPHQRKRMWVLARRGGEGRAKLPASMPFHGVINGASFEAADPLVGKGAPSVLPTLLTKAASNSGNSPQPNNWSICDVLGITAKFKRHGVTLPTLLKSDYKGHSGTGTTRLMGMRSRPLRDILPHIEGGTCINPEWAEWLMGWAVGWTDATQPCRTVDDWRTLTAGRKWWTDEVEEAILPRTLAKRPPGYANRIFSLGNGQVPLCAAVAFQGLMRRV